MLLFSYRHHLKLAHALKHMQLFLHILFERHRTLKHFRIGKEIVVKLQIEKKKHPLFCILALAVTVEAVELKILAITFQVTESFNI